jgi:hypothetical protein
MSLTEALGLTHAALLEELYELEEAARSPAAGPGVLGARLAKARTHLATHFRFEEEDGYMDVVLQREPQRGRAVEELRQEHRRLAESLDALISEAGPAGQPAEAFRAKVRAWVGSVRDHESRENALVQAVFNLDVGAED